MKKPAPQQTKKMIGSVFSEFVKDTISALEREYGIRPTTYPPLLPMLTRRILTGEYVPNSILRRINRSMKGNRR